MTTAPAPAMEDSQGGETERANGVECDAHVSSEQLHCESDAVGSTVSHNDVPQNGSTAQLSDSTSSDEEDDSNRTDTGGGYVLLSQEDLHENESCSCIDDCTATVEVLESSTCSGEQGLLHTGTEQNVVTRFANPGAVIAPVTKMEGGKLFHISIVSLVYPGREQIAIMKSFSEGKE